MCSNTQDFITNEINLQHVMSSLTWKEMGAKQTKKSYVYNNQSLHFKKYLNS